MKKIKQAPKRKKHKKYLVCLLILLLMPCFIVLAKYLYNTKYDTYLISKEFYFYSNILTINNKQYDISNWDGMDYTFNIDINNYLNTLSWTNYDIEYDVEVACPDTVTCKINSGATDTLIYSSSEITTNNINISILTNGTKFELGDTLEMVVKATSKTNYQKTLAATFNFEVSSYGLNYLIEDKKNNSYATLEINNSLATTKNITLTFDSSIVLIDTTNDIVLDAIENNNYTADNNIVNSITFDINPNEEVIIKFYKEDITSNYTYPFINDTSIITLTENS